MGRRRANAQLKTWQILRKLRCCLARRHSAKAIHVLQARETTFSVKTWRIIFANYRRSLKAIKPPFRAAGHCFSKESFA